MQESDAYRHFDDSIAAICDFDRRDYLFEVPRRALVRSGWDNLVTAGRSAAGEGYAWDVLRVIPPAIVTGQPRACSAARRWTSPAPSTLPTSAPCRPSSRARMCCCTSTTRTYPRRAPRRTNTTTDTREDER